MNTRLTIAILLICAGVLGLAYQGFTYTTREPVLNAGSVHVEREKQHTVFIAPMASGAALAGGLVLLLFGRSKP